MLTNFFFLSDMETGKGDLDVLLNLLLFIFVAVVK